MKKSYYKIETSYANYYVEIWRQYPTVDKVFIGAQKKCIGFSVYLNDDGTAIMDEYPHMDGFGFHKHCNNEGNHMKGIGSLHLLNTSMRFIISYYKLPEDIKFQFSDTSFIECVNYNMPLPIYYIIFHGKTWYEQKFGAEPLMKSQSNLEEGKKALKAFLKGKPEIDHFFPVEQSKLKRRVLDIYSKCDSLKECLEILKTEDCHVFKDWLPILFSKFINMNHFHQWVISNTIPTESINFSPLKSRPDKLFNLRGGDNHRLFFRRHDL